MVAGLILAAATAYPLWFLMAWYGEQTAITVIYEGQGRTTETVTVGPAWLRERLGQQHQKYFERITHVECSGIGDRTSLAFLGRFRHLQNLEIGNVRSAGRDFAVLKRLHSLRHLDISSPNFTDREMGYLKNFRKLQSLGLDNSGVTDEGLWHLEGLVELEYLSLNRAHITGPGLVHIAPLRNLERLYLRWTDLHDVGLEHVAKLPRLQTLSLYGAPVTDQGLARLAGLTTLRRLELSKTSVTDDGLIHLKNMEQLVSLHLAHLGVTDAGLRHLYGLGRLDTVQLAGTRATASGVDELDRRLGRQAASHISRLTKEMDVVAARLSESDGRWGSPVNGLRCSWIRPVEAFSPGANPTVSVAIENASEAPVLWACSNEISWGLSLPGTSGLSMPQFRVGAGPGVRPATAEEVSTRFGVGRPDRKGQDVMGGLYGGFFCIEPGGQVTLTCRLPGMPLGPGKHQLSCQIARGLNVRSGLSTPWMTCPPLLLEANSQE